MGISTDSRGASDHGVSEALYLRDPDDHGVELYWDRPMEAWPRTPDGELAMFTKPLDLESVLAAASEPRLMISAESARRLDGTRRRAQHAANHVESQNLQLFKADATFTQVELLDALLVFAAEPGGESGMTVEAEEMQQCATNESDTLGFSPARTLRSREPDDSVWETEQVPRTSLIDGCLDYLSRRCSNNHISMNNKRVAVYQ